MHLSILVIAVLLSSTLALSLPTANPVSQSLSGIPISDKYLPFKNRYEGPQAAGIRRSLRKRGNQKHGSSVVPLSAITFATAFSVEVDIGGNNFTLIFDTGSTDLWVKSANYTCLNATTLQPTTNCTPNENPFNATPDTFAPLPFDNNFNASYGTGEIVVGRYGKGPVTIGNITVPDQWFAVGENGTWTASGDPTMDGIIGFAGPGLSYLFNGTDPTKDYVENKQVVYNPWVYKAVQQNLFDPYFSLVLNRPTDSQELSNKSSPDLGAVILGGRPSESSVPLTGRSTTVKNPTISLDNEAYEHADDVTSAFPRWYVASVETFNFPGSSNVTFNESLSNNNTLGGGPGNWTSVLDSGTGLMVIPIELTRAYNALFNPPAQVDNETGIYLVHCNATAPPFSVTINGTEFKVDEQDLVVRLGTSDEYCASGVQGGDVNTASFYLLGDKFLNNVLTTYNLKTNEITISERKPYGKGVTYPEK